MRCVRCGTCCRMGVVIRVGDRAMWKPDGAKCPHLGTDPQGQLVCLVHDEPWYRQTSCFVYGNSDIDMDFLSKKGKDCPIGLLVLKKGSKPAKVSADECEDIGLWDDTLNP